MINNEETIKSRSFAKSNFILDPKSLPQNFEPVSGSRDRFGNRLHTSRDFSYLNRSGEVVKSGLLVSPQGETFIKENKGIISKLDRAIDSLENAGMNEEQRKTFGISIEKDINIKLLTTGGQSNVYVLDIKGKKFIVKTAIPKINSEKFDDGFQPYVNEMLQVQNLSLDLEDVFTIQRIKLPKFLFASGQLSLTEFVEGKPFALNGDLYKRIKQIMMSTVEYIASQNLINNALWKNIEVDSNYDNFLLGSANTLTWFDPFVYRPKRK